MAGVDGRDPGDDYRHLLNELKLYDPALLKKPRLVAANKMDLPAAAANLAKFKRRHKVDVVEISCLDQTGLEGLKKELLKRVSTLPAKGKEVASGRRIAQATTILASPTAMSPENRSLMMRANRLLGAGLVEHNLVKIEDLEKANERLLEIIASNQPRQATVLGVLAYELKVIREEDVLQHLVESEGLGLVDLRGYEPPDDTKKGLDLDACWATWSVPFDQEEDFTFIATAYYLSPAVRTYWEKKFDGPDPLVRHDARGHRRAPGPPFEPHELEGAVPDRGRPGVGSRRPGLFEHHSSHAGPRRPGARRPLRLEPPRNHHGTRKSPVPDRREAHRHGPAHRRAARLDRRAPAGPERRRPRPAAPGGLQGHRLPVPRGEGEGPRPGPLQRGPLQDQPARRSSGSPRNSARRTSCCRSGRWATSCWWRSRTRSRSPSRRRSRR